MSTPAADLRYPVGKYEPRPYSEQQKNEWLGQIRYLPDHLEQAILNLNDDHLQTPYREGGWTVHEVVHHVADSHINAYCRFKLGLTENEPQIKPYEEKAWTMLDDVRNLPVNVSLTLLHALHARWHAAIKDLTETQWQRSVQHPDYKSPLTLWYLLGSYAWHGRHHVAHITSLRERMGW